MAARAFITGLSGLSITAVERAFLRATAPWGLILFQRNACDPAQVADLVADFRATVGRPDAPVLIDQEGGRVQRLGPPHWPVYPPAATYGELFRRDRVRGLAAAKLGARLIAADLAALAITVNCVPVADLRIAGADPVIGDRAYGETPREVATLALAVADGLLDGGVLPVVKHIPGHGRATADSHHGLPVVGTDRAALKATDFVSFRALAHLPMAMTAHVVFSAIDTLPATLSRTIIDQVIRGFIGFSGLLLSDDISMQALSGSIRERAAGALAAGCDVVLHCNGKIEEMQQVAQGASELTGASARRAEAALATHRAAAALDIAGARAEFLRLIAARASA